ncbi:MAG: DUF2997 domain-containing protein [Kiritimatiellaeota bacterium]|nr:DUF2997 domain-containing protein [Kiritimatiellota bacterium]
MKRTIEVVIGPAGELKIEAMGFAGADCEKATAYLEKALGVSKARQKKPEFHTCQHGKHHLTIEA